MQHNLAPTPALRDAPLTDPVQEIALRIIAEFPGWKFYVLGTAVLIGGRLAITAKHILEVPIRKFGATRA
jgi:hypothetical protein